MPATSQVQERGRRLVEELAGVALEGRDLPGLAAAVEGEMSRLGMRRPADYFAHLEGDGGREDGASLLDLVVNNETYFFREPQHFVALRRLLLDRGGGDGWPAGNRVRVLSAGCSTGEEAYSLAIELLELRAHLPELDFEVLGADISRRALEVARQGVYGPNSFRRLPDGVRLEAWLEPAGDGTYAVSERVRRHVAFHCLNLKEAGAVRESLGPVDVIFFRNVLIYLSDAARLEVCRNLVSSLRRPGYLFIGTSEVLPPHMGELGKQHVDGVFYWKKGEVGDGSSAKAVAGPERRAHTETGAPGGGSGVVGAPRTQAGLVGPRADPDDADLEDLCSEALCAEALAYAREDRAQEALGLLRRIVAAAPDHLEACRLMAELHLDRAEFEAALELSDRVTARDETLAWPYALRGRIAHSRGEGSEATGELRKAIYYQPDWWPAHFFLAEAYRVQGEMPLARRAYENALRNLERGTDPGQDCGADFIGYSREDIAVTCRMNLREAG